MDSVERLKQPPARPVVPVARLAEPSAAPPAEARGAAPAARARRRTKLRWVMLVALVCAAAAAFYWLLLPPALDLVQPHRGHATQAVYATGTVEPSVMIPIAARTASRLVELNADEGSVVTKGQVLARLENDDLRRAIDAAAAEERFAKAELERLSVLVERQVATRSAYDRARADWEKAKAARERALSESGYLELLAPADGTVIRRDGEIGQMIGANQTVFWLSCCAPLRISAEVDEEDIAQVSPGQPVLIRCDAFPGKVFNGQVQAVTPKGDPVARTYRVRIALPSDTPLMIGMTAENNIVLRQSERGLLVPASAVRQDTVWRVEDGHLSPRRVEVGAKGAREIEILSGIGEGDWIVAASSPDLKAGQSVRPPATTR